MRLLLTCWLVLLVDSYALHGQALSPKATALPATQAASEQYLVRPPQLSLLVDSSCTLLPHELLHLPHQPADASRFPVTREHCYWVVARLRTPQQASAWSNQSWFVEVGHHGIAQLYIYRGEALLQQLTMGNDLPINARSFPHIWSKAYLNVAPIELRAGQTYTLLLRYANPRGQTLYGTNDELALTLIPAREIDRDSRLHLLFSGLMMGGMLLLCLYSAAQWTVYRTSLDASYVLMLLGLMAYIMYDDFLLHGLFADQVVGEKWQYFTGAIGLLGLFRFAQLTLRTVDFQAKRDKVIGALVKEKAIEAPLFLGILTAAEHDLPWLQPIAALIPETFRILLLVTLLIFSFQVIVHFRQNSDKATRAFMFGNLSLVIGVLVVATRVYLLPYIEWPPIRWWISMIDPPFDYIIEAGIVGMALCFAFAVALLTKDREAGLERSFNQRLAEARMNALRSQMNPHFLFNGLNSIKSFVISNQPRAAGDYLSKFARLIRLILENSKESMIPLSQELETLELYLKMESLRFADKFDYSITVAEHLDTRAIYVPPTLVQPYVENAIWHGLLHREGTGGKLTISITKLDNNRTQLTIEDNGIGREAAEQHKRLAPTRHRSMGMQITADRIAMLSEMYGFEAEVRVIDLFDQEEQASGTRVTIAFTPAKMSTRAHSPAKAQPAQKPA